MSKNNVVNAFVHHARILPEEEKIVSSSLPLFKSEDEGWFHAKGERDANS
jgi:hypothetical protein